MNRGAPKASSYLSPLTLYLVPLTFSPSQLPTFFYFRASNTECRTPNAVHLLALSHSHLLTFSPSYLFTFLPSHLLVFFFPCAEHRTPALSFNLKPYTIYLTPPLLTFFFPCTECRMPKAEYRPSAVIRSPRSWSPG